MRFVKIVRSGLLIYTIRKPKKIEASKSHFLSIKMSVVRAFVNSERVSTGRVTKDGRFFQAYPIHQFYENEMAWRDDWMKKMSVNFVTDEKPYEFSKNVTATLPAGRYYIGDITYVLKDSVCNDIFGDTNYEPGHYKMKDGEFLVNRTAYGDGSYPGSNNYQYGVDAGVIGITNINLCIDEKKIYGGTLHTFTEPVACSFTQGMFRFSSGNCFIEIDTI